LKIFRANSVFRACTSCSKILNDKKCIFNAFNSGQTLFSGQGENIFGTVYSASKGNYPNVSFQRETTRKELHRLELTSKVTTGVNKQSNYLPITALLGDYIRKVIAELKL